MRAALEDDAAALLGEIEALEEGRIANEYLST